MASRPEASSFVLCFQPRLDKRACDCWPLCAMTMLQCSLKVLRGLVGMNCRLLIWWYALVVGNVGIFSENNWSLLYGSVVTKRLASWMRNWSHFGGWYNHWDCPRIDQRAIVDAGAAIAHLRSYLWKRNVLLIFPLHRVWFVLQTYVTHGVFQNVMMQVVVAGGRHAAHRLGVGGSEKGCRGCWALNGGGHVGLR